MRATTRRKMVVRGRVGLAATAALVLAAPVAVSTAGAAPGNNGTVKVHAVDTAHADPRNEPKVCVFNLTGAGFDAGQSLAGVIEGHGGRNAGASALTHSATTDAAGAFAAGPFHLTEGSYRLTWWTGDGGGTKQKVFQVGCGTGGGTPPDTTVPEDPDGGGAV